jgi:hypothetical protein
MILYPCMTDKKLMARNKFWQRRCGETCAMFLTYQSVTKLSIRQGLQGRQVQIAFGHTPISHRTGIPGCPDTSS